MDRSRRRSIFLSYAREDATWKDQVVCHLEALLHGDDHLEIWSDDRVRAGSSWRKEIGLAIDSANLAILLVSKDFLASRFIREVELTLLRERHRAGALRIVPLLLSPCAWNESSLISELQLFPRDGEPLSSLPQMQVDARLAELVSEAATLLRPEASERSESAAAPPRWVQTSTLPTTSPHLFGRESELELLHDAWSRGGHRVLVLVAWGGTGKTALLNLWLNELAGGNYAGARWVFGWSFYRQGTADRHGYGDGQFFEEAESRLRLSPERLKPWQRGVRLAEAIAEERCLLILDGLEPLQYPPNPERAELQGRLRTPGLQALLRQLARSTWPGLCVVSTRLPVADLATFEGSSVRSLELPPLGPEAAVALLRHLQVEGEDAELADAAEQFDRHPLALTLLGKYLHAAYRGDVDKTQLIPSLSREPSEGGHARRVMESYERWLDPGSVDLGLLYLMGLFDRPASASALAALRRGARLPAFPIDLREVDSADWRFAVARLRDLRLISRESPKDPDELDCHPLVREYFEERFREIYPKAWAVANETLFYFHLDQATAGEPETMRELKPLFLAVFHGSRAGLYRRAAEVLEVRINRRKSYSTERLGAFNENLAALGGFFEKPWTHTVSELRETEQLRVLGRAGLSLSALGHFEEAIGATRAALEIHVQNRNWLAASKQAANLKEHYLKLGDVSEAIRQARLSVEYADLAGETKARVSRRTTLGNALELIGSLEEAERLFREAEEIQARADPNDDTLRGLNGLKFLHVLQELHRFDEVYERLRRMAECGARFGEKPSLPPRRKLAEARTLIRQYRFDGEADLERALELLNEAIDELHDTARQDTIPYALMERAAAHGHLGNLEAAWADLDEAREISLEGKMALNMVHVHIESAWLWRAAGEPGLAQGELVEARRFATRLGYHRAHSEIDALGGLLDNAS